MLRKGRCFCPAILLAVAVPIIGQSAGANDVITKPLVYEVVSVHPSRQSAGGNRVSTLPNQLVMGNNTLLNLLFNAFPIRPHDDIPGMPSWGTTAEFDIDAKMDESLAAELEKLPGEERGKQRQLMLQALLADRFKLRFHFETKERPIYSLQIAKGGIKFKEVDEKEPDRGSSWGPGQAEVRGGSTAKLAYCLSDILGRLVRDDSGLKNRYYMQLKWTPEELQSAGELGPTIFTALREQLGLKLVPARGPVDMLVIDHVEKPTEN